MPVPKILIASKTVFILLLNIVKKLTKPFCTVEILYTQI